MRFIRTVSLRHSSDVRFNSMLRNAEPFADCSVAQSFAHKRRDLALPRRQLLVSRHDEPSVNRAGSTLIVITCRQPYSSSG
jgi:hypothetical protein